MFPHDISECRTNESIVGAFEALQAPERPKVFISILPLGSILPALEYSVQLIVELADFSIGMAMLDMCTVRCYQVFHKILGIAEEVYPCQPSH